MWPFDASKGASVARTHPYYPLGVEIAGYVANHFSVTAILAIFTTACAAVFGLTHLAIPRVRRRAGLPSLPTGERLTVLWFVLCGCIHLVLEGYYAANFRDLAAHSTVLGQLWKEYALSDSRYLTNDSFVVCMETVTAVFWGPLSFIVAYMIATEHPLRHPLQIVVSLGQLYGDVLYYGTSTFDHAMFGKAYSRPEPYYFYGYYVFLNAFWIVIPACLIVSSVKATGRAAKVLKKLERQQAIGCNVTRPGR
ncbi:EBDP4, emopamil-binding protein [Achaetomium macrosporum]|uniref:EBDP4, emopamil-binding protein n=1 Tax=Achaetomium macrosporum TaxID=79813 RepID=A0AAN7CAM0_9PEZI|nr:EBDP4, emopamil-binding protein [Achaetomium macrosporum]